MSAAEMWIIALFALLVLLPFVPGALQQAINADDGSLAVDGAYVREPRFLGRSMRALARAAFDTVAPDGRIPFLGRRGEFARVVESFEVGAGAGVDDAVLARRSFRARSDASVSDVYARGRVVLGEGASARTLAADDGAELGAHARVERWLDVEGACTTGAFCVLGRSASASGVLLVGEGSSFERLFGRPVVAGGALIDLSGDDGVPEPPTALRERLSVETLTIGANETIANDIVANGDVVVGHGASVRGSITSYGSVRVLGFANVSGNVIAERDVTLERGARVLGHCFAGRDAVLWNAAAVGTPGAAKTVRGGAGVTLAAGARVHGWVIAEHGGQVVP